MGQNIERPDIHSMSLRDLILTMKGSRTYLGLEQDSGGVIKAQRWNQVANGIRISEFPEPRTITAMADALNVEVDVVLMAFARTLGLSVKRSRSIFADLLPPAVDGLSDKQKSAVLSVIRAMNEESGDAIQDEGYFVASGNPFPGEDPPTGNHDEGRPAKGKAGRR